MNAIFAIPEFRAREISKIQHSTGKRSIPGHDFRLSALTRSGGDDSVRCHQ
jgi:hypothetical protein